MMSLYDFPDRTDNFTGRWEELQYIDEKLSKSSTVTITGSLGVGKTSLAVEYGYRTKKYDNVCFFRCGNSIGKWLLRLADYFKIEKTLQNEIRITKLKEFLGNCNLHFLIVIDSIEDDDFSIDFIRKIFPSSYNYIFTSRIPSEDSIELQNMPLKMGALYLTFMTGLVDLEDAESVSEALQGWPLGLRRAAYLISQSKIGFSRFLRVFDKNSQIRNRVFGEEHTNVKAVTY